MVTTTRDTTLLKEALATARFVAVVRYTNVDESPDAELPWDKSSVSERLGFSSSPREYSILVLGDGVATNFRGFESLATAWDAVESVSSLKRPTDDNVLAMTQA